MWDEPWALVQSAAWAVSATPAAESAQEVVDGVGDRAPGLLRLEARFCCNKRLKKIIAAFPRTFDILAVDQRLILREFAEANPQTDVSSLENARQFYEFLLARWRREPPNL